MKVKIEIQSTNVRQSGFQRNGTWHDLYSQSAYLHTEDKPYPQEFEITLPRDRKGKPYECGFYTLAPESLYVDARNFRKLSVSPVLMPASGNQVPPLSKTQPAAAARQ